MSKFRINTQKNNSPMLICTITENKQYFFCLSNVYIDNSLLLGNDYMASTRKWAADKKNKRKVSGRLWLN